MEDITQNLTLSQLLARFDGSVLVLVEPEGITP